mmetsp:Transcript_81107/g.194593  ORF Transcript_81107/g.194593 Transcript_81107/m.194593 type:complete len:85 (-) Transcript_81107:276-530(-)
MAERTSSSVGTGGRTACVKIFVAAEFEELAPCVASQTLVMPNVMDEKTLLFQISSSQGGSMGNSEYPTKMNPMMQVTSKEPTTM